MGDTKEGEYIIASLNDLFAVPAAKRVECLRQIAYAFELDAIAAGGIPTDFRLTWREGGDRTVDMVINGEATRLVLKAPRPGCSCKSCRPVHYQMLRCPDCGAGDCPKVNDHRNTCAREGG